jgi:NitT/TauT family transport system ATP-binding protein
MDIYTQDVRQVFTARDGSEIVALDNFTHRFKSGQFTCILGPSGCGKSTLAQIVGGIERAKAGSVRIENPIDPAKKVLPGTASVMVWQNQNLFPWRTILENVAFGPEMARKPKAEREQRAIQLINSVGLRGFEKHYPTQLSGGMRQRAALARALMMDRPIMLMDEPFGALDAQTKIVMQEELLKIFEETRKTVIFVTHSIDEAILLGDEVIVMTARPGRIKEVIPVDLPRPRSFDLVNTQEFGRLFDKAFHLIRDEVTKAMAEMNQASHS